MTLRRLAVLLLLPAAAHAATKPQVAQGHALYHTSGCEHCHGPSLAGTDLGPSLQGIGKTASREELTHQIVHGGGGMPAFSDSLNDEQIARLVDFLESQKKLPKKPKHPAPTPAPPAPKPPSQDDSGT